MPVIRVTPSIPFNPAHGFSKGPVPGIPEAAVEIVQILRPVQAESHLKIIQREKLGQLIGHERAIGLHSILKDNFWEAGFQCDDFSKKVNPGKQRLPAVPVHLDQIIIGMWLVTIV